MNLYLIKRKHKLNNLIIKIRKILVKKITIKFILSFLLKKVIRIKNLNLNNKTIYLILNLILKKIKKLQVLKKKTILISNIRIVKIKCNREIKNILIIKILIIKTFNNK